MTPIKAIRAHCIQCSGGNRAEVRKCVIDDCPLYPFRMGHNPNIRRKRAVQDAVSEGTESDQ